MQDVAKIFKQQDLLNDPYWKSIFQSDLRNIFPKYQLAKIDGTKNRLTKLRFIMENIQQLMIMQMCKKDLQNTQKINEDQDLKRQLEQIQKEESFSNFEFNILSKKPAVQELAYKLNKTKINENLKEQLLKNQKWGIYIKQHYQSPNNIQPQLLNNDKVRLGNTTELIDKLLENKILQRNMSEIVKQRIKCQQVSKRLIQIWKKSCKDDINIQSQWRKEWQKTVKGFDPAEY